MASETDGALPSHCPQDVTEERQMILPIKHPELWGMYQKARSSFWLPREIHLADDIVQWRSRLSDGERHTLSRILAFFATADGIVSDNLLSRFSVEVPIMEAKFFYAFQAMMENIHAETYALLLVHLFPEEQSRQELLRDATEVRSIADKNEWARKWILDPSRTFQERLVAFACVEGIFFSSSFAVIYWFKFRNLLPGICQSNDLISRDEGLHTDFACLLLRELGDIPSEEVVTQIVTDAVDVELGFVRDALAQPIRGLNASTMTQYVRFVADQLMAALGYRRLYGDVNPIPLAHMATLPGRTNFFERTNVDYHIPVATLDRVGEFELTCESFARGEGLPD